MEDKKYIITKSGKLSFEIDEDSKYPGIFLKLDGVPLILLEENKVNGEDKIIIKNYQHSKTVVDNDYMNLDKFEIDMDEIDKIREQVLNDLE